MPSIKLQSSDGEIFPVDVEIAKQSVLLLGMDDGDEEVVPLPNVNAAILKKVIQWATYHKDDPPLPEDDENKEKRTDDICSWDADFLKVGTKQKFQIYITAVCGIDSEFRTEKNDNNLSVSCRWTRAL